MEDLKKLKVKNWKETATVRRTCRDLAEKAKTHKGLQYQMMMMMMIQYNFLYVTIMASRILRWLLDSKNVCLPPVAHILHLSGIWSWVVSFILLFLSRPVGP